MNPLVQHIVSYLSHLNTTLSLHTSIHLRSEALDRLSRDDWRQLAVFNSHTHPYCMMIKSTDHTRCFTEQAALHDTVDSCGSCHTCHAGVQQYVYPICTNGNTVGFAAISGYRTDMPPRGVDPERWTQYLQTDLPLSLCRAVLPPLCLMVEQLLARSTPYIREENAILQYLNEYHTDVTLDDICTHFHKSRSYISHMFKTTYGVSIRTYCNALKLEDARKLLVSTDRSITDIAMDTGFSDTSYFIHLFGQTYGISPLRYRKQETP